MIALLHRLCATRLLPLSWTLLIIILLCLPGSAIPGSGIFAIPGLDKVIHAILFGSMVLFWGLYIRQRLGNKVWGTDGENVFKYKFRSWVGDKIWFKAVLWITFSGIALGIGLEYIQRYFIVNRSFEVKDILADMSGVLLGLAFLLIINIKKPL